MAFSAAVAFASLVRASLILLPAGLLDSIIETFCSISEQWVHCSAAALDNSTQCQDLSCITNIILTMTQT